MTTLLESNIARLNRLFEAELGMNPPVAWKWSEDLLYLKAKFDTDGLPVFETKAAGVILVQVQAREVAKMFPELKDRWVACQVALFPDSETGQIHHMGQFAWIPIGAGIEPLALDPDEVPDRATTLAICQRIRHHRKTSKAKLDAEAERERPSVPLDESSPQPKFARLVTEDERRQYRENLDLIKNEHTAFLTIPGEKGRVSFPSVEENKRGSSSGSTDSSQSA